MDDFFLDISKYIKDKEIYNDNYYDIYTNDYLYFNYKDNKINMNNEIKDYEQFYANYNFIEDKKI